MTYVLVLLSVVGFTAITMGASGPLQSRALFGCAVTCALAVTPLAAALR